jgi:hypothetical protein
MSWMPPRIGVGSSNVAVSTTVADSKDDQVSQHAFGQPAAPGQTKPIGRLARHLVYCILEREHRRFTCMLAQDAGTGACLLRRRGLNAPPEAEFWRLRFSSLLNTARCQSPLKANPRRATRHSQRTTWTTFQGPMDPTRLPQHAHNRDYDGGGLTAFSQVIQPVMQRPSRGGRLSVSQLVRYFIVSEQGMASAIFTNTTSWLTVDGRAIRGSVAGL